MEAFRFFASERKYRQELVKAIQSEIRLRERPAKPSYTQQTQLIKLFKQAMALAPSCDQSSYVKKHINKLRASFVLSA
ncbi:MAG: hypothetical protein E3J72_10085 [Planctomycetota bacterium]|nr:MAG: hypothetical protein E3J72_10085 [Planctomycetota bacterium]